MHHWDAERKEGGPDPAATQGENDMHLEQTLNSAGGVEPLCVRVVQWKTLLLVNPMLVYGFASHARCSHALSMHDLCRVPQIVLPF